MVVLRRLLHAVMVAWLSVTAGFVALHLVPGNPVDALVERGGRDAATRAALKARYGVDQPVAVQYLRFVQRTARGELGVSLVTGAPVAPAVRAALGRTLLLAGAGVAGAMLVGGAVGAAAAWRPRARLLRHAHTALTAAYALPEFLLALGVLWLLAYRWRWFPVGGVEDPLVALTGNAWARGVDRARHLALPALTLAVGWAAAFARQQRAAVGGLVHAPAVQVARAKGVAEWRLFTRPLVRPTLATPLRVVGLLAPTLAGGALVVETVFGWPGVGTLLVRAIHSRDYFSSSASMMAVGCVVAVVIFFAELLEMAADPRRQQPAKGEA
jgi:peptide/nickel transport system permease protein